MTCWRWAYQWGPWKQNEDRFCSIASVFAARGSPADELRLVRVTKSRFCEKCGKYQNRKVMEYYVREPSK
jgi:hypothetical protein